jgi:hypothetical protein
VIEVQAIPELHRLEQFAEVRAHHRVIDVEVRRPVLERAAQGGDARDGRIETRPAPDPFVGFLADAVERDHDLVQFHAGDFLDEAPGEECAVGRELDLHAPLAQALDEAGKLRMGGRFVRGPHCDPAVLDAPQLFQQTLHVQLRVCQLLVADMAHRAAQVARVHRLDLDHLGRTEFTQRQVQPGRLGPERGAMDFRNAHDVGLASIPRRVLSDHNRVEYPWSQSFSTTADDAPSPRGRG